MTKVLAKRAKKVVLVDYSLSMLDRARKELKAFDSKKLDFRVGELEKLPLRDSEVDGAFSNLVFHHVDNLAKALSELFRILKPNGTLVISDLFPHEEEWMRQDYADLRLGIDPKELEEQAKQIGFKDTFIEEGVDILKIRNKKGKLFPFRLFVFCAKK